LTAPERAISNHVVVQCPSCGAYESAEAATLADQRVMVCRECGETWPAERVRARHRAKARRRRKPSSAVIVAERQPLVTYSHTNDNAWQAKIEGDRWPEPPRQRRLPMTAAAVASALFLAAFFGAREAAVAAIPDLAGLYSAIGLPVNLERLAIKGVKAERTHDFAGGRVSVQATLSNLGATARTIPPLVAVLRGGSGSLGEFMLNAPAKTLGAGQSTPIVVDLDAVPDKAVQVELRFLRQGETLPSGGKLQFKSG
jgi:hypothetical protein